MDLENERAVCLPWGVGKTAAKPSNEPAYRTMRVRPHSNI